MKHSVFPLLFPHPWFCRTAISLLLCALASRAEVRVTDLTLKPRWPWNGLLDITFSIWCNEYDINGNPFDVFLDFSGYDKDLDRNVPMKTLTGKHGWLHAGGPYTVTWDSSKDFPEFHSSNFEVTVTATSGAIPYLYLVVDLSGGPDAEHYPVQSSATEPDLSMDSCRTTELWLRKIPSGTFQQGSTDEELGKGAGEQPHQVSIDNAFYIGIFEVTQKQYELVTGDNPSCHLGATRPVENINYTDIRGQTQIWPTSGHHVDGGTFLGRLQAKTGLVFDLPTEAQWEYACRAETTTALNSGENLNDIIQDAGMDVLGRYYCNTEDQTNDRPQHATVGTYLPNARGLYDMHGNVWEWCLDWYGSYNISPVSNPAGPASGTARILRGGSWNFGGAQDCRSATRHSARPSSQFTDCGFRVVLLP